MSRCESPRWLGWLSLGSLTGLTFLLGLTIALSACEEEPGLALWPVELVDPAPSDPLDIDPLLGPPALDCGDCAERRIELPGGDVVTIRGADEPALRIAPEAVAFFELASDGGEEAAAIERFGVYAVFDEGARAAWQAFAAEHARRFVLVEVGGRPVDLVRPLGWSRGLRIGVFEDEAARAAYLRTLPFERGAGRSGG